jgi:hypothetical protein
MAANASFDGGDTLLSYRKGNLQIVMPHESQNATGRANRFSEKILLQGKI